MPQRRIFRPHGYTSQPLTLQDRLRNRLLLGKLGVLDPETVWTTRSGGWRHCWVCWTVITPDEVAAFSDCAPPCHISCVAMWQMESLWFRALRVSRTVIVDAETTFCIECSAAMLPGDPSTTINWMVYHSWCFDRMVTRQRERS